MAFSDLTDQQRQQRIQALVGTSWDLTTSWLVYSDQPGELQDLYTMLDAIDYESAQVRKLMDTTLGNDRVKATDQFNNLQTMRKNALAEIVRQRGSVVVQQAYSMVPSAYDDAVAARQEEFGT